MKKTVDALEDKMSLKINVNKVNPVTREPCLLHLQNVTLFSKYKLFIKLFDTANTFSVIDTAE